MSREIASDVVVVGAGVSGLLTGLKLAQVGLRVTLVERSATIAPAASSRNEGWLHAGTYHASAIADPHEAVQVARKCLYGYHQIRNLAPESLEWSNGLAIALVAEPVRAQQAEERWEEAQVRFRRVRPRDVEPALPNVDLGRAVCAYLVQDVGIDIRLLYRRLLTEALRSGVSIELDSEFHFVSDTAGECVRRPDGAVSRLRYRRAVLAAGHEINRLSTQLGCPVPLRLWKSHILYGPQLVDRPVFWLDPLEVAIVNHAPSVSVVGMTTDAIEVEKADFEVEPSRVALVEEAMRRTIVGEYGDRFTAYACIKVDMRSGRAPLSVNSEIRRLSSAVYCVSPGKLTEAPFVADRVVHHICDELLDSRIPVRPWDRAF
ncbi:FAD-dependent oxidoreductase [Micromonospora avicenniae]|uniref:FAD dependent oxidoreductase n=1 Tax=Micromonospora avicenniae TaxID=1198245 RepID=A0A1N6S241_9ACTN|nr:FAD-dependent oxidoreductase [Micromonospora avicenniae]SIQ35107.1 FAD dependent oxidoreductase [Micromonospora avicenniae]